MWGEPMGSRRALGQLALCPPVLTHAWHETPNIHLCTILDFVALCEELDIVIERRKGRPYRLNPRGGLANLLAEQALFLLRRAGR